MSKFDKSEIADIKPGPILWAASHPVAANLMMIIFIVGGLLLCAKSTKEVFPNFSLDNVIITMSYPGASPAEIEQGIILPIENAIDNIDGLGDITSSAMEGYGSVTAEILNTDETIRILQDVKTATDRITTFPVDAEDLSISINEQRRDVVDVIVYGDIDETALRTAAEQIKETLERDKNIGAAEFAAARDYQIHIEIPQENLRRYNLTLPEVSAIIRETAIELGGGSLKTDSGEILVRMNERRDTAIDFRNIPIVKLDNGAQLLLKDIAKVSDGFDNSNKYAYFNGKPALRIGISRVGDQTPTGVSSTVKKHVEILNESLPDDLQIAILNDRSIMFEQRAALLIKNGIFGLILVIILLALFLDVRLAFWVSLGIPISFLGSFLLFPATFFTINMITMFAFIISLGIVVDDAIVSGENIYHYRQKGYSPLKASVTGAREIAVPITVSIITNIVAFMPMFFVPGMMGKVFSFIPIVVISVFIISLIESLFILPAHLTFKKADDMHRGILKYLIKWQKGFAVHFQNFIDNRYKPFLKVIIKYRYLTLASFLAVMMFFAGFVLSGKMGMQLFPRVESDFAFAEATLKVGAPLSEAEKVEEALIAAAQNVINQYGDEELSEGIFSSIEENKITVRAYLTGADVRPIGTMKFTNLWREALPPLAGLETLSLTATRGGPSSSAVLTVELSHSDTDVLDIAAIKLANVLEDFSSTKDINDGSAQGKRQFEFKITDLGHTLGMNTRDIARQVRAAFYGSEVFKQQQGRNEVRVLVRLPEEQRSSQYFLKNLIIHTPKGDEVLLRDVVTMEETRAHTAINRNNGRRVIQVQSDVNPPSQAGRIIASIKKGILPELQQRYPGLTYSFEGRQAEMRDSIISLMIGLGAVLFVMYAILAVLFGSYAQPMMVIIAIPFSAVGAVVGHLIMGYSLSVVSMLGMLALAGVVVNDSLLLIDFANRKRNEGIIMVDAVMQASLQRFRPIILTTMTTFVGLMPIMFETSRQARFLIPMALSLGYGIIFATLLTLVLIPALYLIIEDIKSLIRGRPTIKPHWDEITAQ
jgi:multidrug efflux pump subunit AcrB